MGVSRKARRNRQYTQKADPNVAVVVAQQGVGTPAQMPRNMRAYIQEGYRSSKTVFRVVGHIARAGAGIKWKHYTDKTKKREIVSPDDELMVLWDKPAPRTPGTMFREAMIAYYCMTGNSYLLGINANQNPTAKFDELYNLRPDLTKIKVDDNGPLYYEFGNFTPPRRYADPFVMHNKLFAGNDDIYGMSPIEVAAMLVDIQKAGQKWNLGLLNNMARPGGAWVTDALLGPQEYKSLKEEIRKKFAGPRNAGETAILHGGVKWQSMSMSPYELDWLESDTKGDRDIAGIFFNFPTFLLGLADATFDNQDAAKRFLYTDIVFPIMDMFEDSLNMWLTPRYGGYLGYDRDDVETIADQIKAAKAADSDRATAEFTASTTTFHEAREIQGKTKLPVKDFMIINSVPVHVEDLDEYIAALTGEKINPPTPPPQLLPAPALPSTTVTEVPNQDDQNNKHLPGRHNQLDHGRRRTFKDGLAGKSISEKEQYISKHGGKQWLDGLSENEKKTIEGYTSEDYKSMNKALRGKPPKETKQIKDCQAALLKSKAPVHMMVTRGYADDPTVMGQFVKAARSGDYFQEKGFASATIKTGGDLSFEDGFRVNIKVFKGAPGAYVAPLSDIAAEREFLIPHGAQFKVTGAKLENGQYVFEAEYKGISLEKFFMDDLLIKADDSADDNGGKMSDKFVCPPDGLEWLDKEDDGKSLPSPAEELKVLDLQTADEKAAYFKTVESQRTKWEKVIKGRLESYFGDEHKTISAAINRGDETSVATNVEHALLVLQQQGTLKNLIVSLYQDVGEDSGKSVLKDLKYGEKPYEQKDNGIAPLDSLFNLDLNLYAPDVLVYLLTMASTKVAQINDTTLAQLQSALEVGVQAGESIAQLSKRIDDLYLAEIIPNRSQVIAATEVAAANNYGSHEAAKASDLSLNKVWLATDDNHTRPDHRDADGQTVGMDEPFQVGGSQLMFPGDTSMGAAADEVIRCRCTQYYERKPGSSLDDEDEIGKALMKYVKTIPQLAVTREEYRELLRAKR